MPSNKLNLNIDLYQKGFELWLLSFFIMLYIFGYKLLQYEPILLSIEPNNIWLPLIIVVPACGSVICGAFGMITGYLIPQWKILANESHIKKLITGLSL